MSKARVVIIGAGGYSGAELAWWLLAHPSAEVVGLFASARREKGDQAGRLSDLFPRFRGLSDLEVLPVDLGQVAALRPDAVFLATPHEASLELASGLLKLGASVFDLSAAFRLKDAAQYPPYYGFEHSEPRLLANAVYGLPEHFRREIAGASLIAVPGCYPTSAILPLRPIIAAGGLRPGTRPIVDSTSGVSGAGRSATQKTLFCEVSLQPYNVLKHRHTPEIAAYAGAGVVFTPHLGAFDRGILSTIHVELADGWTGERVARALKEAYAGEPFVRLLPGGQWPAVRDVVNTNFCDIGWAVDEVHRHLIMASALDNLVKGAAGQAIQCMNIRLGLGEMTGLLPQPGKAGRA
ncbi:MAG: N-acetyl-gamma-glutamyl-phosphate reductase [Phycisphaerales bacterium]|nr:N-acetyl-gamma-glutamyl-phosphate reductase [Phycisphaerales bacterium]